jgi:hypothetical protein
MVMLVQLDEDLRGYMKVLNMTIKTKKNLKLHYSLRSHGSEHLL